MSGGESHRAHGVLFQRFYVDGLAQASYLIADGEDALVVDPRRDVDEYLECARRHGLRIRWALATHVHADFVAGLRELQAATGAAIGMGARYDGGMACSRLEDGVELCVGNTRIKTLSTPGHTPESVCYLVSAPDAPQRLLSGDTLFIGDVGRPDLVSARGFDARAMARALWTSLHDKIAPLADATEIWPAHGAGSACGSAIGCETSAPLGSQRLFNWALAEEDQDTFVERLVGCLRPPPRYFAHAAAMNRDGPRLIRDLAPPPALDCAAVARALASGALLLDTRDAEQHGRGHWPGALNVGLSGSFESWCGALIPPRQDLVLHARDAVSAEQARQRLLRIGYEAVVGACDTLPARTARLAQIEAKSLLEQTLDRDSPWQVVDVRRPQEFASGHLPGAVHAELGPELARAEDLVALDPSRPTAVVCAGGYRSSAAAHFLAARGFVDLHNVVGGMRAVSEADDGRLTLERSRA